MLQHWYCERCGHLGTVNCPDESDFSGIINFIDRDHYYHSSECGTAIDKIRVISEIAWDRIREMLEEG